MHADLWSFTLDLYAKPGIEAACLSLQASGGNVCLLLCGVWLMRRDVACNAQRALEIGQLARPWHDDVVRPLRELRTHWRNAAQHDPVLGSFRERVKALELAAERELLMRLESQTQGWSTTVTRGQEDWLTLLAGEAADNNRDALHVLRVAANQA